MRLFKVLDIDGTAYHGGDGKWSLPKGGKPGKWMPPIEGELIPCKNGYHACHEQDLLQWLGPKIYELEYRGEIVEYDNKVVIREARLLREFENWNECTARLFACDCAEHVLDIFEKEHPDDERPRKAIEAARQYARSEVDKATLDAARTAAWAAAWAATWAAAGAAAWAATWAAAEAAAWATAEAAAWDAAKAAAEAATWAAAGAAARDATQAAAEAAAWDAAWAAAEAAAEAAAWDAAGAAERKWQTRQLTSYLCPEEDTNA